MKKANITTEKKFENALKKKRPKRYVLHLYVAGLSPRSQVAIENIRKICEERLKGRCELKIQDIYKNPIFAQNGQILAVPTLVKKLPLPIRRFVGDLSDTDKLLVGLDLHHVE